MARAKSINDIERQLSRIEGLGRYLHNRLASNEDNGIYTHKGKQYSTGNSGYSAHHDTIQKRIRHANAKATEYTENIERQELKRANKRRNISIRNKEKELGRPLNILEKLKWQTQADPFDKDRKYQNYQQGSVTKAMGAVAG